MKISVRRGDITEQSDVDAIVNAANTDLVLGAGVAGAIRRKGGEMVGEEARLLAPIRLGEAVATTAGHLPNRFVIHAAAMGYRREDEVIPKRPGSLTNADIIFKATQACLRVAHELKLKSVAFPALGTGVAGFPIGECAKEMLAAVWDFGRVHPSCTVQEVVFVLFDGDSFEVFREALRQP
jgi:O-acetyl-ADP-ribose deacetylase (regulator of RNase III)